MVERQLRRRGIYDERVLAAMLEVPRERFVPEDMRRRAYRVCRQQYRDDDSQPGFHADSPMIMARC